ncbi:WhiB family transcriptional regulator [Actinacidiphila sp. ITFR-21]|uniref:WhiB family transcriptional regulator n=1 Tax=Actinacidiphila sp. ITFR-21 TaxID=3075199 RepID=UPI00288A7982|nr:WhiB family transcriptional regulator [Streptomyces sp. ITFR-21]WNI20325.1 WhiB family transcriptional regulator [Streptomyces sp. ITFR-21]
MSDCPAVEEEMSMARRPRPAPDNLPRPYHWSEDAACSGVDTERFFPVGAEGVPTKLEAEYAKALCVPCPVRSACLAHALTRPEHFGVWGGMDEGERAELLRSARRAAERERRREREHAAASA